MPSTAEAIDLPTSGNTLQPWEVHHDLTRLQTQQYLSIGTTKFYDLLKAGLLQTYRIGPDGRGSQRVVRESIERLRSASYPPAQVRNPEKTGAEA